MAIAPLERQPRHQSNDHVEPQSTYSLNPDCTYSCGMSNGGYMSYSLACNNPERFARWGRSQAPEYEPEEVVPVIHLHGTSDFTVGYNNGVGFGPWGDEGVPEIIDLWTGMMGTTEEDETDLPNLELVDLSSVEFFYGAPDGQEFHHYRVSGGTTGGDGATKTELLWDFFQSHCAGEFTSVEEAPHRKPNVDGRRFARPGPLPHPGLRPARPTHLELAQCDCRAHPAPRS